MRMLAIGDMVAEMERIKKATPGAFSTGVRKWIGGCGVTPGAMSGKHRTKHFGTKSSKCITWKRRQEKLFNTFERVEALEFLKDIGIITQRDYWILTGNYRIVDC